MSRIGYFDSDGKCIVILSGVGEPPSDLDYAYTAEIPAGLTPNTVEHTGAGIRKREHKIDRPVKTGKTQAEEIAELKAEIAELKKKIK